MHRRNDWAEPLRRRDARVRCSMSHRFFWCFSRCAQAIWAKRPALLLENRAKRDASPSLDLLRRIAQERVPTIGRAAPDRLPSQRHRLGSNLNFQFLATFVICF